ncbi:hypothetical protein [uncultured Parasutterella sp.]|uniref:hypothetical protein n=1 Tax=uncultured Parasutterella sp. TaxID=1263098 RepID=UPI0025B792F7|nr:hypothetical protein [uncultured Parasutterella sp.]
MSRIGDFLINKLETDRDYAYQCQLNELNESAADAWEATQHREPAGAFCVMRPDDFDLMFEEAEAAFFHELTDGDLDMMYAETLERLKKE